jgi:hypothetical protein
MKSRTKKHIKRPLTKRKVEEVEGTYAAHSVRKHLRIAQVNFYNEADVEDIVSNAWLAEHDEKILREELEKQGLEWTPENLERMHQIISERSAQDKGKDSATASKARRAAECWKENRKQLREISLEKPIYTSENGDEILLREALQQPEEDLSAYIPSEASQKFQADQVLTPEELKWLADYDASRETKGKHGAERSKKPRTAAERQRAQRLRKKAKRKLEKIL